MYTKQYKRRIPKLFISIILVCSVFVSAQCETYSNHSVDSEKLEKLMALGVIDWGEELTDAHVTRGEFASWVANMLNVKQAVIDLTHSDFTDITPDSPYLKPVVYLSQMGIVSKDAVFQAEQPILYAQAIKMLVNAIGYETHAQASGGYPAGHLKVASERRIAPSNSEPTDGLLRAGLAVDLLERTIDIPILRQTAFGSTEHFEATKNDTILSVYHNIHKTQGVLNAVGRRSITPKGRLSSNKLSIQDEVYINNLDVDYSMLGSNVIGYYKTFIDSDAPAMLYIKTSDSHNTIVKVDGDYIEGFDNNTISYQRTKGGGVISTRFPDSAYLLYNYNHTVKYTQAEVVDAESVTLIDNNNDGEYDVVSVVNQEIVFVSGVNTEDRQIFGLYGEIIDLVASDATNTVVVYNQHNEQTTMANIPIGSVVGVIRDKQSFHADIYIFNNVVKGKIHQISGSDLKNKEYIVGDKSYFLAKNAPRINNLDLLDINREVTLFLTDTNKIAGISAAQIDDDMQWGYLIDFAPDVNAIDKRTVFMLYTSSGEIKELKTAVKWKINDRIPPSNLTDLTELLTQSRINLGTAKQLVKYQLDDDGYIKQLEIAEKVSQNDLFNQRSTLTYYKNLESKYGTATYNKDDKTFLGNMRLDNDTLIMFVPVDHHLETQTSYYAVKTLSEMSSATFDVVETYNVHPDRTAGAVVIHSNNGAGIPIQKSTAAILVTRITSTTDDERNSRSKLYGFRSGAQIELNFAEDCPPTQYYKGLDGLPVASIIERGDIVRVATNSLGEICDFYKLFSLKDRDDPKVVRRTNEYTNPNTSYKGSGADATMIRFIGNADSMDDIIRGRVWQGDNPYWFTGVAFSMEFGIVQERYGTYMMIDTIEKQGVAVCKRYINMGTRAVYVVDEEKDKIYIGSVNDITAAQDGSFDAASRVIYARYNDVPSFMVVVKRKV